MERLRSKKARWIISIVALVLVVATAALLRLLLLGDNARSYEDLIPSIYNPIWTMSFSAALVLSLVFTLIDRYTIDDKAMAKERARRTSEAQINYYQSKKDSKAIEPVKPTKLTTWTSVRIGLGAFGGIFLLNMIWLYAGRPIQHGFGLWWYGVMELFFVLVVFVASGFIKQRVTPVPFISAGLALLLLIIAGFVNMWWYYPSNAHMLAELANVTIIKEGYPSTDVATIPAFGPQEARQKADRGMNEGGIGTLYDPGKCLEQKVDGKRLYVCELLLTDRKATLSADYDVPGYMTVDPYNKDAVGKLVSKTNDGAEIHISWVPNGWFGGNLERLVWKQYGLYPDELVFQIDDNRRPFYTTTLNSPPMRFDTAVPEKFITIDAQTGETTEYKLDGDTSSKLPPIPSWVERVISEKTARQYMDWWGRWGQAKYDPFTESSENRFKVHGSLNLVFTDDGNMAWQILMGSWRRDSALQYIVLFNTRGELIRAYPAPAGLAGEAAVIAEFEKSPRNIRSYDPTNMGLYRIYGEPVWVGSLVANGAGGVKDDNEFPQMEPYVGSAIMRGQKSQADNAILAYEGNKDGFDQLSVQIARQPLTDTPNSEAPPGSVTGIIERKGDFNDASGPVIVLQLKSDDHLYRGRITYDQAQNLVLLEVGDAVKITFLETGKIERAISTITRIDPATLSEQK